MTTSSTLGTAHDTTTHPSLTAARQVTVLSVGYLVLDLITTTHLIGRSAGGTAGNVAANLAWLGHQSGLLARIGDDDAGAFLRDDLAAAGVETAHVHRNGGVETPMLIQRLTDEGPQYLFRCPVCDYKFAAHRPATREQAEDAATSGPSMLFVDRASKAALDLMEKVKAEGGIVIFEPNGPGRPHLTAQAIALADILKVSDDRITALGGLLHTPPKQQIHVRTRGAQGLEFRIGDGTWHKRRARRGPVNDSAGAGDWVTAGLIAHLTSNNRLTYRNISDGLELGQALAAVSCAFVGARGMNKSLTWDQASALLERPDIVLRHTFEQPSEGSHMSTELSNPGCVTCGSRVARPARVGYTARP